jgi:hypothetical protein
VANHHRPEYGLPIRAETPEGALDTGRALARTAALDLYGDGNRTIRGSAEPIELGRPSKDDRRQQRQEGQGVPKGVPAVGRENL